jgi:hypothetical protein
MNPLQSSPKGLAKSLLHFTMTLPVTVTIMAVLLEGRKALHWLNSILISLMVSMLGLLETGTPISCFPSYGTGNMQR